MRFSGAPHAAQLIANVNRPRPRKHLLPLNPDGFGFVVSNDVNNSREVIPSRFGHGCQLARRNSVATIESA